MMWDNNGWDGASWGPGGWLMLAESVIMIAAATMLVAYLLRNAARGPQAPGGTANGCQSGEGSPAQPARGESPREIARRRCAAGEIGRDGREEYRLKLGDLTG